MGEVLLINPESKKEFATDFPVVTIADMVRAQKLLIDYLKIAIYAVFIVYLAFKKLGTVLHFPS